MPDDSQTRGNFGMFLEEHGHHKEADAELNAAIELQPGDNRNWVNRGWAYAHRGQWGKALADYDKAIELSPKDPTLHNDLAWELANYANPDARHPEHALKWARKAVELEPKDGSFWNTLGVVYYRAGDCGSAIAALEKSMQLRSGGDSSDWFFLSMCQQKLGEKQKARTWYDRAVLWMAKNEPNNAELRRFRVEAEQLHGLGKSGASLPAPH
jgi:tetratricopeptide (TPR) repeat protein